MKILKLLLLSIIIPCTLSLSAFSQKLKVYDLTCEYMDNPVGIDALKPELSWKLASTQKNVLQTAYEIRVASDIKSLSGKESLWSTGKVVSDQSIHIEYAGKPLQSRQRCYWQVRVWDNQGNTSAWSTPKYWEMGLLKPQEWLARWLQLNEVTNGKVMPSPRFRKGFQLAGNVRSARLYITAHGLYEANINGSRVGDHYFTPGWTSYHKRLQYQTYDVTTLLKNGKNAIGVTLGDGWYRGNLEFNKRRNVYGKELALLAQLEVEYTNGKKEIIGTDESWKTSTEGPIRASDIYNGETYDSRLAGNAWVLSGFNDAGWQKAKVADINKDVLIAPIGPPVIKQEKFAALKIIKTPKGETVVDFGQNLVGWEQIKITGKAGDTVTVQHAEVLDKEGNFYIDNLRGARQENKYILKGGAQEVFEPHFTFHGFRYIKIMGYPGELKPENVSAFAVYSQLAPTGSFTTSNPLINQLQHNIQWGQRGNFLDVPTDCPQRDERLGWTGDAQVFFNTAAYNMNVAGFFSKWLKDLKADQLENGNVPVVIPNVRAPRFSGSAGWADAATIIPWNFYEAYGDKKLLKDQYPSMKAWVDFMVKTSKDNLSTVSSSYGDWLFYSPTDDRYGKAALTDKNLIAQAFYVYSTQLLVNAADVLGMKEDIIKYNEVINNAKKAFLREYVTPSGRLVSSSQTAYVLALNFDLLPENLRDQAAERLVENVKEYGNHLTTGFIGTPYLCHVLSRFGYTDVAYSLLMQDTYPSWLYPVKMGATTIWERWDGIKPDGTFQNIAMNSFNHYSYGAIGNWMYKTIAGITKENSVAAYKHIVISPQPGGSLTTAAGELETPYGKIKSGWVINNGKISLDCTIPPNTTATIVLPQAAVSSSSVITGANNIKQVKAGNNIQLQTGSGTYHFEYNFVTAPNAMVK